MHRLNSEKLMREYYYYSNFIKEIEDNYLIGEKSKWHYYNNIDNSILTNSFTDSFNW